MEDIDFCVRCSEKGLKIFYFPETKVIHYQGRSSRKNFQVSISNQLISKIKYFKIHFSKKRLSFDCINYYHSNDEINFDVYYDTVLKSLSKKLSAYLFTLNKILSKE